MLNRIYRMAFAASAVAALVLATTAAYADILRVPSQYATIQDAIDAAVNSDTVLVADGIYTGVGNKNLDFGGKLIEVISENGPDNCIIDCENDGRGFYFHSGETSLAVVEGFTIQNGAVDFGSPGGRNGGGILCNGSSPTIRDCVITNCTAFAGGGIACEAGGGPTVTGCTIDGNSADLGGGITARSSSSASYFDCTISANSAVIGGGANCTNVSDTTFDSCQFLGNTAGDRGGGVFAGDGPTTVSFVNCLFTNNSGLVGAGVSLRSWFGTTNTIINCTITGNNATATGGGVGIEDTGAVVIANSIIYGNTALGSPNQFYLGGPAPGVTYSNIEGGFAGTGNIDADPLFADPGGGDFHITSGSPCIDAADNDAVPAGITTDLDGNPRFVDDPATPDTGNGTAPIVDIGCYELPIEEVTVLPDGFTILRGLLLSGGLPDLFFSDDSRLVVRTAVFAPSIEPPVQIEVVGTSPTESPSELRFRFEGMASRDLIQRRISLYNYVTQSYEELHVAFAATSDEVVEIVVTSNASRFVEPGTGQVKSLMTWKAAAFSFFTGWNVGIDQTIWKITP